MNRPTATDLATARRFLEYELSLRELDGPAAGRVYDKLRLHLAPVLGDAGVQLLFMRSAKLTKGVFAGLSDVPILEGSTRLRQCLHAKSPAVPDESAIAFFGAFFSLMRTLIGERLTNQVLRSLWPTTEPSHEGDVPK